MNTLTQRRIGARRWLAVLALTAAALTLLLGAAGARAASYTALGDSYAAGPLIPNQSLNPLGCLRSSNNYAHLAAPGLGLALTDVSCSGATTVHMTQQQNVEPGPNPPQFNGLNAATTVVSITIGGNDIGFSEVAQSCITINPFSHPCLDKYKAGGKDQLAERITATAPKVAAVLQGIHSISPLAKIYVLNYPAIFPETGIGCWPQMPIGFQDVPYLRSTEKGLNSMLATQAAANGATLVNWYNASIGHDACKSSSNRWVEPLIPGELAAPIHPNKAGMQGGANALLAAAK
ncbi:MAG TPA: SGNH/GDSL hydrolase family protein [Solirubrobacterales bacterium]